MTSVVILFGIPATLIIYLIIVSLALDVPFKRIDKTEGESYMEHDVMEPIHYKKAA